jgi:DNA-binding beta-propeller fold protein YncE
MKRGALSLLGAAACLALVWAGAAEAKDIFFYIGYDVVQVLDGTTDEIVADIPAKGWLRDSALSPDGKFLYITANRHRIHKIDVAERKLVKTIDVNGDGWDRMIYGFSISASGRTAYAHLLFRTHRDGEAVIRPPAVAEIDLDTGKVLRSVEVPWGAGNLIGVADGRTVYTVGQDLVRVDVSGPELKVVEVRPLIDKGMNSLPFWPNADRNGGLAVAPYYTATGMGILFIDTKTAAVVDKPLKDVAMIYTIALSPDRKRAYGNMDDLVMLDLEKGKIVKHVPVQEGTNFSITISSDGKKLYCVGGGYTMTVFDAETLKPLKVVRMASDGMDMFRVTR